jgi:hypothetical protein
MTVRTFALRFFAVLLIASLVLMGLALNINVGAPDDAMTELQAISMLVMGFVGAIASIVGIGLNEPRVNG